MKSLAEAEFSQSSTLFTGSSRVITIVGSMASSQRVRVISLEQLPLSVLLVWSIFGVSLKSHTYLTLKTFAFALLLVLTLASLLPIFGMNAWLQPKLAGEFVYMLKKGLFGPVALANSLNPVSSDYIAGRGNEKEYQEEVADVRISSSKLFYCASSNVSR